MKKMGFIIVSLVVSTVFADGFLKGSFIRNNGGTSTYQISVKGESFDKQSGIGIYGTLDDCKISVNRISVVTKSDLQIAECGEVIVKIGIAPDGQGASRENGMGTAIYNQHQVIIRFMEDNKELARRTATVRGVTTNYIPTLSPGKI